MSSTFGAPSRARFGIGHAGCDTSKVRPITPENACPGLYSLSGIWASYQLCCGCRSSLGAPPGLPGRAVEKTLSLRPPPAATRKVLLSRMCGKRAHITLTAVAIVFERLVLGADRIALDLVRLEEMVLIVEGQ